MNNVIQVTQQALILGITSQGRAVPDTNFLLQFMQLSISLKRTFKSHIKERHCHVNSHDAITTLFDVLTTFWRLSICHQFHQSAHLLAQLLKMINTTFSPTCAQNYYFPKCGNELWNFYSFVITELWLVWLLLS